MSWACDIARSRVVSAPAPPFRSVAVEARVPTDQSGPNQKAKRHVSRYTLASSSHVPLIAISGRLFAQDGVVIIDQTRAIAGNVTPGDVPGVPVTISRSGSYRLDSNLILPNASISGHAHARDIGTRLGSSRDDRNVFSRRRVFLSADLPHVACGDLLRSNGQYHDRNVRTEPQLHASWLPCRQF
jgi:hypothetical protein